MEQKQLKKNDFLKAVTEEPMSREQLVDSLDEYSFIGSYLDYLTDHFVAQGKIAKNDDGTIQRIGPKTKSAVDADLHQVTYDEDEDKYDLITVKASEVEADDVKNWSRTPKAAVKVATSAIFHSYKERTASIRDLLPEEADGE